MANPIAREPSDKLIRRLGVGDVGPRGLRAALVLSLALCGWCGIAASPASADDTCKPAAPLPQSRCIKDAQCCPGLVCEARGCQPGCRIDGTFHPSGAPIDGAFHPSGAQNGECQSCQPAVSTTSWTNLPSGTPCGDGNECVEAGACEEGVCVPGEPVLDGELCDDGISCTKDEFCFAGECGNGVHDCPTAPCAVTRCNTETDTCELDPVVCRTPESSCYATTCQGTSGVCITSCAFSECGTGPFSQCTDLDCLENADCEDDNPCTFDTCNANLCSNAPFVCNDGDPLTADICDPAVGCIHRVQNPQVLCDDGDACTLDGWDPENDVCVHTPVTGCT